MADWNVGNAYLQVIPSFRGVEKMMMRETDKLARSIDDSIAKGANDGLTKAFRDFDSDKISKSASKTSDKWSTMFESTINKHLKDAAASLPEFEPKANLSKFDRAIAQTKKQLTELSNSKIGPGGDTGLDELDTKLGQIVKRMTGLADETKNADQRLRLLSAAGQADMLKGMVEQARSEGLTDGRTFGGAFAIGARQSIDAALKNLPEVNVDADTSPALRAVAELRAQLETLGEKKIGVDIDRDRFEEELVAVKAQIESLSRDPKAIELKYDLDKASASLRKFADEIEPTLNGQMDKAGRTGGDRWSGAFAAIVNQKLTSAIQSIPNIPMTVDNTDAERKLAAIRVEMEGLAGKTIGVDIDAGAALAVIAVLKDRLNSLDSDDVSVDVRTNALAAAAELEAVARAAGHADQSIGGIGTTSGLSMSRLGYMIAIGASIGSLISPAAVAASVAIAGIGVAAAGAAIGAGVLALAVVGIGDAVKKMDAYQQDANKSAKSFSQAQNAVLSATDAVRNAETNLKNVRQDAADAAVQAQQRIADAQRNVVRAQRDSAEAVKNARENERQAILDVASARVDAHDSIAAAVQSEQDAERAATKAVKDQSEARLELNKALKDAVNNLRELDTAVKRNGNEIDKATTASMAAKLALDKILTNPRATEIEKRMAKEAYDEQIIQIESLKEKQTDLLAQQKAAAKDGVESTAAVKNAREALANADERAADAARRVADAQKAVSKAQLDGAQKVAKAEQRVDDARQATVKAQVDGAERVADAQRAVADAQTAAAKQQRDAQRQEASGVQGLTAAQRALAAAHEATGVAGGEAFDNMNDALNNLSPAAQRFAKFIFSLKPALQSLREAAQSGLLPGLQDGIQSLVDTYLPSFLTFVGKIAKGLGAMFRATSTVLAMPQWRAFFTFLSQTALPSLQGMWVASLNLARGVANIIRALSPLSGPMGQGLVDLTERFAQWSDQLDTSTGFQKFLAYAKEEGPKVVILIESMVTFVGRLLAAMAPMGAVVVAIATAVFQWMNSWDIDTLSGVVEILAILGTAIFVLSGLVNAVKFAVEAWNAVSLIAAGVQKVLAAATLRFNTATVAAVGSTGLLNGALFSTAGAGAAGAGGMVAMSAALGPLAIALAGIAGIWYLQTRGQRAAKESTDELAPALQELGKAYETAGNSATLGGAAVTDSFRRIVSTNADMQKAVVTLTNLGASLDVVAGAASGSAEQLDKVVEIIETRIATLKKEENDHFFSIFDNQKRSDEMDRLWELEDAFKKNAAAAHLTNDAMALLSDSTSETTASVALLTPAEQALADASGVLADKSSTAQQKVDALTKAQDVLRQSGIDAIEAEEGWEASLDGLTSSVNAAKAAHDADAKSLDIHTATGRTNRDMLEALIGSADKMYDADVALNGVTQGAIDKGKGHYEQIRLVAKQLGLGKIATDNLITAYGKIPTSVETAIGFKAGQFDAMFEQLEQAAFIQKGLKNGDDIDKVRADFKHMISDRNRAKNHGWAAGGPIGGPGITGGKTEDANLIRASKGEFMQQASAVDYYGESFMHAVNQKKVPKEMFQGLASGGAVGKQKWPFQMDLHAWVPTDAELQAAVLGSDEGSTFTGLSPDASVRKMQQWALAQRGKRYLWSAVGPARYDCSGLVGNLWAMATGHSLYHRYMSTGDMGPGRHGMVAGPGKKMTVYLGPGHTAANISGLHAEAYGGNGVPLAIGHVGTPLSYYNQKLHIPGFAGGGPVDPSLLRTTQDRMVSFLRYGWPEPDTHGRLAGLLNSPVARQFDSGGMLPPGYSTVLNATGRPEPVLNGQQWSALNAAAGGGGGPAKNYNFEFRDTTLDAGKLRVLQDQEATLARQGRAR